MYINVAHFRYPIPYKRPFKLTYSILEYLAFGNTARLAKDQVRRETPPTGLLKDSRKATSDHKYDEEKYNNASSLDDIVEAAVGIGETRKGGKCRLVPDKQRRMLRKWGLIK
ncbi:hypothetical protein GQ457_03G029660 [Hibiscus cannabinus]